MNHPVSWLVFDLGGVLVDVAPAEVTLAALARRSETSEARLEPLLRERFVDTPYSLAERFQIGALDEAGFHAALNDSLDRPLDYSTLIAEIEAMLLGEKRDTVALLARLAAAHRIACYSNTNATHWRYMLRQFGFFAYIERAFASQELGVAKPDPRGFAHIAAALDVAPAGCLLIDDRQINVDGARAAGWQAIQFTDAATLERDLATRGINVGASA